MFVHLQHLIQGPHSLPRRCSVESCPSVTALDIHACPGCQQSPHGQFVPTAAGVHQGSPPIHILGVQDRFCRCQLSDNVDLPKLGRPSPPPHPTPTRFVAMTGTRKRKLARSVLCQGIPGIPYGIQGKATGNSRGMCNVDLLKLGGPSPPPPPTPNQGCCND